MDTFIFKKTEHDWHPRLAKFFSYASPWMYVCIGALLLAMIAIGIAICFCTTKPGDKGEEPTPEDQSAKDTEKKSDKGSKQNDDQK